MLLSAALPIVPVLRRVLTLVLQLLLLHASLQSAGWACPDREPTHAAGCTHGVVSRGAHAAGVASRSAAVRSAALVAVTVTGPALPAHRGHPSLPHDCSTGVMCLAFVATGRTTLRGAAVRVASTTPTRTVVRRLVTRTTAPDVPPPRVSPPSPPLV